MKLKITILLLTIAVILSSCGKGQKYTDPAKANEDFETYKKQFIEDLWKQYPGWATAVGYHKYDSLLVIPDSVARGKELNFIHDQFEHLADFPVDFLNENNRIDYYIIRDWLSSTRWYNQVFQAWKWDPSSYNVADGFDAILNGKYDKLETRLNNLAPRLKKVAAYYKAAEQNIDTPTLVHTKRAIIQNKGTISMIDTSLVDSINKSSLADSKKQTMIADAHAAANGARGYVNWLQQNILTKMDSTKMHNFHIGKDLYKDKFKHDLIAQKDAVEIYWEAVNDKRKVTHEMIKLTDSLAPKYFPMVTTSKESKDFYDTKDSMVRVRMMLDKISQQHISRDSLVPFIRAQIAGLQKFINDKNLLTQDIEKPLTVRETPVWMRGPAGASISSPGPYDKDAQTFYNVTPIDKNEPNEQAESYLREYNNYTMQILSIHEAVPGHYTQGVYANKTPDMIKTILGNGAMVEGWAVYGERMMMEAGYDNTPEMWLMYYKWHLREICNTIIDYNVHVEGWNKAEVMNLLVNEAFQEEAEAAQKWTRVSETQVQLCSYYTGYKEIYDLREEMKKKLGDKFDLKAFHEKFLSYGRAPVKYIRMLMLKDEQ